MKTTKEKIAVMQAFEEGKKIEIFGFRDKLGWEVISNKTVEWNWSDYDYRIASEPKLRPWKAEEVPVGAIVKNHKRDKSEEGLMWVIVCSSTLGVTLGNTSYHIALSTLCQTFQHSLDHGKTWHPCGIKE